MNRAARTSPPGFDPALVDLGVGVFAGAGASHSWTWTVDCLEKLGFSAITLLDEDDVRDGGLERLDTLVMGGGDPVAMADGLGSAGASALRRFVEEGGLYMGICAGAYLVMRMDYEPLAPFTFTDVRAGNVVCELPPIRWLPEKASTAYGGRYALHPVREAVRFSFDLRETEPRFVEAPLYGGAPMFPSEAERESARFDSFTPGTVYLVDEDLAADMLLGAVAACHRRLGLGRLHLLAPHVEHPGFPAANALLGEVLRRDSSRSAVPWGDLGGAPPSASGSSLDDTRFRGLLGEARIVAHALESAQVSWLLGHKYYDPGKIPVFIDAVWRRLRPRRGSRGGGVLRDPGVRIELESLAEETVRLLRLLKAGLVSGEEGRRIAALLFPTLSRMAAVFLNEHFRNQRDAHVRGVLTAREAG